MYLSEFLTIAIAHLFAVASPGPDFAIVLRQSVSNGRRAGLWTSAGIALGILLHVTYCVLGVALLLSSYPNLFLAVKLIAALYLMMLGFRAIKESLRHAEVQVREAESQGLGPAKWLLSGFLTNGPRRGEYRAITDLTGVKAGKISRADVAHFILAQLASPTFLRQTPLLTY